MQNKEENQALLIPGQGIFTSLNLEMDKIKEAERRIPETKMVSPVTYADLELAVNEAYRDLKRHLSSIGYEINKADKAMKQAKSVVLLDKYPDFMKDKPKTQDNSDMREAFLMKDQDYLLALDRLNQMKALESYFDGKMKVMENTSRYMKKQMDLLIRGGLSSADLYNTQGRRK